MQDSKDTLREKSAELYPIRTVANITGINSVTLRAWERRYQLIQPLRTETGHRLYSQTDIDKINKAAALLEKGISISQAAQILLNNNGSQLVPGLTISTWQNYRDNIIHATSQFNEPLLEETYQHALSLYPIQTVTRMLIIPSLQELGNRWQTAKTGIAEEHFFSVFLRNKLGARFHHRSRNNNGPKLLGACLPNESHEIGLLLFALAADEKNYQQILLGANMPIKELKAASLESKVDAIVLSGKSETDMQTIKSNLTELASNINLPVFVGGHVSTLFADMIKDTGCIALGDDIDQAISILDKHLKPQAARI